MRTLYGAAVVALLSMTGCPTPGRSAAKAAPQEPAVATPSPAHRYLGLYQLTRGRGEDVRSFTLWLKAVSPEGLVECEAGGDGELRAAPGGRLTPTGLLTVVIEATFAAPEAPADDERAGEADAGRSEETWTIEAELGADGTLQGEVRLDTRSGSRVQPLSGSLVD